MFPQGDTTGPKSWGLVFLEGGIADTMSNEATDGFAPSGSGHFSGAVGVDSRVLSANERRRPEAKNRGFGFASCSRGLVFPDGDVAGPNSNTAFDPSLEYFTDRVVLFWQPPYYFSPWFPSSFVVDDVPYSCVEQNCWEDKPWIQIKVNAQSIRTKKICSWILRWILRWIFGGT